MPSTTTAYGLVKALGVMLLATSALAQDPSVVQCAANKFEDVAAVIASCNFINLYNISVPAGVTLDLSAAKPNSVIFFGREITFGYKKWKGPLIRFKGNSGLYVNGGTANIIGSGEKFWGKSGERPFLIDIDNVQDSTFVKFNLTSSPYTAINVKNSKNLIFQRPRVTNLGQGDKNVGIVINTSQNITITDGSFATQADGIDISSGSGITVKNTNLTFTGLSIGNPNSATQTSNLSISNIRVAGAKTAIDVSVGPAPGSVDSVAITNVTLIDIANTAVYINQPNTTGGSLTNVAISSISGNVAATGQKYAVNVGSCDTISITSANITGATANSTCSCVSASFTCQ